MGWLGELFLDCLILGSDWCTCGTFASLLLKLKRDQSLAGVSFQTVVTVVFARTQHIGSHFLRLHFGPSRLPWILYVMLDVMTAALGVFILAAFATRFGSTYEREKDNFGIQFFHRLGVIPKSGECHEGPLLTLSFLYSIVTAISFFWTCAYPVSRSFKFATNFYCIFGEVLAAVALLPQLWMFHTDKRVSRPLANFVVLTAMSRLFTIGFWVFYPTVHGFSPANRNVRMSIEAVNMVILADFLFYWLRSKLRGDSEVILSDGSVV
eukprot:TRINITY_DN57289_c0_g1_i1.p1 TRINITY_DN57289_c0_g1~~TRINITY_DN57289_c0_g1_i1.p1  ORF type:complete len:266 (-),score=29.65 TRINITY_DN57289_c0_g1_i1:284-1081(-)